MSSLTLEFCGEHIDVDPATDFTFGRLGTLQIDDNKFLHRVMGSISLRMGLWWLANVGTQLPMHVEGCVGGSSITLSPGSTIPLVFGPSYVRFAAGGTSYELKVNADILGVTTSPQMDDGETTVDAGEMPLTPDQLLLLVALAEPRLRRGHNADLPTNSQIAGRFGWSMTKFNRKLDNVCVKFHRKGVSGLVGNADRMAQNRRGALVDYVIASGLVTVEQLFLLPQSKGTSPPS